MKKNNKMLAGVLATLFFLTVTPIENFVLAEEEITAPAEAETEGIEEIETDSSEEEKNLAKESAVQEAGDRFVDSVTLWDSDGKEVTKEVSLVKRYKLRYELISPLQIKLNDNDVMRPPYMEKGKEYILPQIPKEFCDFAEDLTVRATDRDGNIVTVATVRLGEDGIPVFVVDPDLDKGSLLGGYFEIEVNIDREKIGEQGEYTFVFPKGGSLTADIAENKELPPDVSKEATFYDPDSHVITWRITVRNAQKPMKKLYPIELTDTIGEGQTYVEGSFRMVSGDNSITENFISENFTSENLRSGNSVSINSVSEDFQLLGNRLLWKCSDETEGAVILYEYQTRVDVLSLLENKITNEDISVDVKNTLAVTGADKAPVMDDITAVYPITEKTPVSIAKSEGNTIRHNKENNTGEVEWTITVTSNGYDIKDLTVYDYFEAGTFPVTLKGTPVCSPQPVNGRGYDAAGGVHNGMNYQWSYHIGEVSGYTTYTITYTAVIENYSEYLKRNNGVQPGNKAWFSFTALSGNGTSSREVQGEPVDTRAAGIYANILEKTGSYDAAAHRITWTIVINPNRIALSDAVLTDRIPAGQKYVRAFAEPAGETAVTITEENNVVIFDFGEEGLNGRTVMITLITELEESEADKWANNWDGTLFNHVTLNASELSPGGVSDTGAVLAKSVVLDKELGAFDYATHTLPVTIQIDQNQMNMTGVKVTDKLSEHGLALVREKGVAINGILLKEGTQENRPSYSYDGDTLEIYPGERLTEQAKITFTVQVKDEYINAHCLDAVIDIENTALLTSDQYGNGVTVQAAVSMKNTHIMKTGTVNNRTGIITYNIELNRTLADLPAGLILTDTLPDGLQYRQNTVKLWFAEIDGSTGTMKKTDREADGYRAEFSAAGTDTVMQISLPKGKQAYILEYEAQIVDKEKAPFINSVSITGYPGGRTGKGSLSLSRQQVSGARLEDLIYFKVKKEDAEGNPLSGAVFALKQGEEQILMGITGEDGYVIFTGVEENTEYTLAELQAPEGYAASAGQQTIVTGTKGGEAYALETVFVNREKAGEENWDQPQTPREDGQMPDAENKDKTSDTENSDKLPGTEKSRKASDSGILPSQKQMTDNQMANGRTATDQTANAPAFDEGTLNNAEQNSLPEFDRLPQTGGFWIGSILYMTGAAFLAAGTAILYCLKKAAHIRKRNGIWRAACVLIGVSALLIVAALFINLYFKYRNQKEVNDLEDKLFTGESYEAQPELFQDLAQRAFGIMQKNEALCKTGQKMPEDEGEMLQTRSELSDAVRKLPDNGEAIAVLSIPSISCKEVVREGSGRNVLAKALGHIEGSALPGENGNCVIAGHRNYNFGLYFNRLNEVKAGDEITVATEQGMYIYVVTETKIIEPEDLSVLKQTEETRLTLITCTPIYIATHRFIVIAELK